MKLNKRNPDVWNSIAYVGTRQDFFRIAKGLIAGALSIAEKDSNFDKNLENSKIYVIGTVGEVVVQKVLFVWKNSKTYKLLEKNSQFTMTEEELDSLLKNIK